MHQCRYRNQKGGRCQERTKDFTCTKHRHRMKGGTLKDLISQKPLSDFTSLVDYALSSERRYMRVRTYLAKKFSEENLLFLKAVHQFKKKPIMSKFADIYFTYVSDDAEQQVNLPHDIKETLDEAIQLTPTGSAKKKINSSILDAAEDNIKKLIDVNHMNAFKKAKEQGKI